MTHTIKQNETPLAAAIVDKIEGYLEERKKKTDRRQAESSGYPAHLERRSGVDRRNQSASAKQ